MEERNQRPPEGSKLPVVALGVLVFVIGALLLVGYEYASDDTSSTAELTNVKQDPTMQAREASDEQPTPPPAETKAAKKEKIPAFVPPANVPDEASNSEADATDETPEKPARAQPEVAEKKPKPEPAAKPTGAAAAEKKPEKKPEPAKAEEAPAAPAKVAGGSATVTHTVADGQTFYGIANRYNVKWETLKKLNPEVEDVNIKVGVTKLRIPVRAIHTVGPGDILRVVARKYGVTVEQLMAANGKTKNSATRGEKLVIPYSAKE